MFNSIIILYIYTYRLARKRVQSFVQTTVNRRRKITNTQGVNVQSAVIPLLPSIKVIVILFIILTRQGIIHRKQHLADSASDPGLLRLLRKLIRSIYCGRAACRVNCTSV